MGKWRFCIAQGNHMSNKTKQINVRLTEGQITSLLRIVDDGKAKTISEALVYIINQYSILNSK